MQLPGARVLRLRVPWLVAIPLLVTAAASAEEKPKLVLLPLVVHSSESPEYLREGMADMMMTRFVRAGVFEVVRVDDPKKATTRVPVALETARELGGDFVLFGSFTRFGSGASLDMQAASTTAGAGGETLREIFVHAGSIGEVIPDLTDLVGKVTRFAIADYQPPEAAPTGPGAGPARAASIEDLRRRVAALESALEALRAESPASP